MEENTIKDILTGFEDTIFLVRPKYIESSEENAETKFYYAILKRAIDDLAYLFVDGVTREQFNYARSALIWVFIERDSNIKVVYNNPSEFRKRRIQITSFDSICRWLNIHPDYLRRALLTYYPLSFMQLFIDN